jgi:hypothetical protein
MGNKITVGKASSDLMLKSHDEVSVIDQEREMQKGILEELYVCLGSNKSKYQGDFFIVMLRKRERAMSNVFRNYFFARKSCPTPTFDQTVFKYHREHDALEFIWVIPDMETATIFKGYALEVEPEERELLKFVLDFYDGTLDGVARKLNNEGI